MKNLIRNSRKAFDTTRLHHTARLAQRNASFATLAGPLVWSKRSNICPVRKDLDYRAGNIISNREYSTPVQETKGSISTAEYHAFSDETMESLLTAFETLVDEAGDTSYEVEYSSGVLTLNLGNNGTYVINKQPPNKQIWLSSPTRYDYNPDQGKWLYSRDGQSLGQLLEEELSSVFDKEIHLGIEPEQSSS